MGSSLQASDHKGSSLMDRPSELPEGSFMHRAPWVAPKCLRNLVASPCARSAPPACVLAGRGQDSRSRPDLLFSRNLFLPVGSREAIGLTSQGLVKDGAS